MREMVTAVLEAFPPPIVRMKDDQSFSSRLGKEGIMAKVSRAALPIQRILVSFGRWCLQVLLLFDDIRKGII